MVVEIVLRPQLAILREIKWALILIQTLSRQIERGSFRCRVPRQAFEGC